MNPVLFQAGIRSVDYQLSDWLIPLECYSNIKQVVLSSSGEGCRGTAENPRAAELTRSVLEVSVGNLAKSSLMASLFRAVQGLRYRV